MSLFGDPITRPKFQLTGTMASNAIAGTGDTFPNTANIDFGPASPPAGGVNASSMIAGAKKPGFFSSSKAMPRAGYMLGRAAQAIMGPYQNTPAALLGGVGAEMSQQEAQKRTAARLLAGENLEDIEEASILSPQQQQVVLGQSAERRKQKFDEATMETKLRFEAKKLGMDERSTDAYVQEKLASLGLIKKQVETFESPTEKRDRDAKVRKEEITLQGDQQVRVAGVERDGAMDRLEKGHKLSADELSSLPGKFQTGVLGLVQAGMDPKEASATLMGIYNKVAEAQGKGPVFKIEEPVAAASGATPEEKPRVFTSQKELDNRDAVEPKPEKPAVSWTDKLDPNTTAFYPVPKDPRPDWLINVEDNGRGTKDKPVLIVNPKPEQLKWLKDGTYIANRYGQKFIVREGKLYAAE